MLASLTPCLRHRSATETPASCSFKIPMICSSEKRLRFHALVLVMGQSELQPGLSPRGKVIRYCPRPRVALGCDVEGVTSGTEQRRHAGCMRDHDISELVLLLPFAL